jgi:VCBS repeat-containing protein
VLRLTHNPASPGTVHASFDLLGGLAPRTFSFIDVGHIFGTGTPGDTSDDELWTRAEFRAAADGVMQNGVYGTLSIDASGEWNYLLNNAPPNVQALDQGEHVTDVFTVTVTDGHGASDTETVTVDVVGSNDLPLITGGTNFGFVAEDTPSQTASGQLFASDSDHRAALHWSAGPARSAATRPPRHTLIATPATRPDRPGLVQLARDR